MRAIDADALTEDCKRYLGTLNPDKDGKECTRIHWLIGVIENAPTIEPEPCEDAVSRAEAIKCITYDEEYMEECLRQLPSVTPKQSNYKTDHGFMWICPDCGLVVHSDFKKCVRCGHKREDERSRSE